MDTPTATPFNYEAFDRHMELFLDMCYVFLKEYEEAHFQEKVTDLRSLCIKAARVCRMTESDLASQQEDVMHHRRNKNNDYLTDLTILHGKVIECMHAAKKETEQAQTTSTENPLLYVEGITELLPSIGKWMEANEDQRETFKLMIDLNAQIQQKIKESNEQKIYPEVTSKEHLTDFLHFFNMVSYLLYHFQRMTEIAGEEMSAEEGGRLLNQAVQQYLDSEEGSLAMHRFECMMHFQYPDGFNADDIKAERRKLVNEVPASLQASFMGFADQPDQLALSLQDLPTIPTVEENDAFLLALAKYQWFSEVLYFMAHPESKEVGIYNKVFHTSVGGKPVDMKKLHEKIGQMIDLASRKNHWFCIYSVLKFRNLIKDSAAKHFAEQMTHPDWFPELSKELQFNGDTLTEYNGYLNDTLFTAWNQKDYDSYRTLHHKTRWAPDLWRRFQNLCYSMNEVFK